MERVTVTVTVTVMVTVAIRSNDQLRHFVRRGAVVRGAYAFIHVSMFVTHVCTYIYRVCMYVHMYISCM